MREFTLYWSGSLRKDMELRIRDEVALPSRLVPYPEIFESRQNKKKMRGCERLLNEWIMFRNCHPTISLMVDSGAFEIFRMRGAEYTGPGYKIESHKQYVDDYCNFLKKWENGLDYYIVFDHPEDYEETFRWQEYMEKKGLHPLPVYHFGEPEHVLEHYLDNYDYICLGGLVPALRRPVESRRFLHNTFHIKKKHEQKTGKTVKFHGLGVTNKKYFFEFPFASADSAEMTTLAGFGKIRTKNGMYIKMSTYEKADNNGDDATLRWNDLTEVQQEHVMTELDELGFSYEDLSDPKPKGRDMRIRHFFRVTELELAMIAEREPMEDFFYQGSLF